MAEHTKGPWMRHEDYPKVIVAVAEPTTSLLALDMTDGNEEDPIAIIASDANARLIAAAPELLEALERLADIEDKSFADNCYCACCGEHPAHGQPFGGHADNCALVAARLAIAKARGDAMTLPDHTKPLVTSPPPVERTLATQAEECRCTCTRREP